MFKENRLIYGFEMSPSIQITNELMGQHGEKKKAVINHLFFEDIRKLYPQSWDNMKTRAKSGVGAISR